jgi:hypothetical protein
MGYRDRQQNTRRVLKCRILQPSFLPPPLTTLQAQTFTAGGLNYWLAIDDNATATASFSSPSPPSLPPLPIPSSVLRPLFAVPSGLYILATPFATHKIHL